MAKILIFDIETAPKLALVWRFFKENISPKQVKEHCHIMSYAAKWLGSDELFYQESRKANDKKIVQSLVDLLDEADVVVAHNGKKFDLGTVKGRAIAHGIKPPSPYKVVDTLISSRKEFNFESNSLEYLAKVLGCTEKQSHKKFPGFELWLECLRGNEEAWDEMRTYNIQDVITLEEIYLKMRPYISDHPNIGVFEEADSAACPKCGSTNVHFRGYTTSNVLKYRKYQCQDCGGWGRTRYNETPDSKKRVLGTNA